MMGCSSSWLSHGKSLRLFCWATCLSHCFVDAPLATGAGLGLVMLNLMRASVRVRLAIAHLRTGLFKEWIAWKAEVVPSLAAASATLSTSPGTRGGP